MTVRSYIVLAPHLRFPVRNGADALVVGRWEAMSRYLDGTVTIVAEGRVLACQRGSSKVIRTFTNRTREQGAAVLRALVGSHYLYEKFITPRFSNVADDVISRAPGNRIVVASFPSVGVWASCRYGDKFTHLYVETHNDEFKWFQTYASKNYNPIARRVAKNSIRWLHSKLPELARKSTFIHVSEDDQRGYHGEIGPHTSVIAPVGVETTEFLAANRNTDRGRLIFVGSLSVQMNYEALCRYAEVYEPGIKAAFGEKINVVIAGSNPSSAVQRLCANRGWQLEANVSDDRLVSLLRDSTFALMPFRQLNGGKLKLLKALAYGVPILGTSAVGKQLETVPHACVFADDPTAWTQAVTLRLQRPISEPETRELFDLAMRYSWDTIARTLTETLERSPSAGMVP